MVFDVKTKQKRVLVDSTDAGLTIHSYDTVIATYAFHTYMICISLTCYIYVDGSESLTKLVRGLPVPQPGTRYHGWTSTIVTEGQEDQFFWVAAEISK